MVGKLTNCPECKGRGLITEIIDYGVVYEQTRRCKNCNGTGRVKKDE